MEKIRSNAKKHGNIVFTHLKKHHKKYLFGIFGGYAVVKTIILFLGLMPALAIKSTFADNNELERGEINEEQERVESIDNTYRTDSPQSLVWFNEDVSSTWRTQDSVEIEWADGATGGYIFSQNNNTGLIIREYGYTGVTTQRITLTFNDEGMNGRYVCVLGQLGDRQESICSENEIKIDRTNPTISLRYPSDGADFPKGSSVALQWSGSDRPSGVSEYELIVVDPEGVANSSSYGSNASNSTQISLNKAGRRYRSVKVSDYVFHSTKSNTGYFDVYESTGGAQRPFVRFNEDVSPVWVTQDTVKIQWLNGATGGYIFSQSNDTGSIIREYGYTGVTTSEITLTFNDESMNGRYVCALGQYGEEREAICSENEIKIDRTNPIISLTYPSNSARFQKGSEVTLRWAGSDGKSGISGYKLITVDPLGSANSNNYGANTINSSPITLNTTGTWYRSVTAYDNLNHSTKSNTGYFEVYESTGGTDDPNGGTDDPNGGTDDPNGGNTDTGFYLIGPVLGEEIELGNNVTLSWNHGSVNDGYIWEVKKFDGTNVLTGFTTGNSVTINSEHFSIGAYSWSVKNIASGIKKSIQIFYIVNSSDLPDLKVNQFEFDEIEDAELDEYYKSNEITIRGLSDNWYTFAYLGNGKGALYINGDFVGSDGFVKNGDKVYIELKASSDYNEEVKTILYVGAGADEVSGQFKITTRDGIHGRDNQSLTPMQKLWGTVFVDNLIEMYKNDKEKLATFLSTFMQVLQDKSDFYASKIQEAEENGDEELLKEYKLYKEAIDFLYITVKYRYDNLEVENYTVYIAPNGKQYLVEYNETRMAYTSPDFVRPKYFPTRELFKNHIDTNNPASGKWGIVGNVITTHNGKVYTIYETKGKWTSSNFQIAKYFDSKDDIINYILANNPASNWNHKIDPDFQEVTYTAPNGKVYKIFKTSSKGNNPNMYSSYNFVNAKYFTSLEAAKKFIDQSNPKK